MSVAVASPTPVENLSDAPEVDEGLAVDANGPGEEPDEESDMDGDAEPAEIGKQAPAEDGGGTRRGADAPAGESGHAAAHPPKKPMSAYFIFMKEQGLRPGVAGAAWKGLDQEEKARYMRLQSEAKDAYEAALREWKESGGADGAADNDGQEDDDKTAADLPLAIINRSMRFDQAVKRCTKEAQVAMRCATRLFLENLGKEAASFVTRHSRKQIRVSDVAHTMREHHLADSHVFLHEDFPLDADEPLAPLDDSRPEPRRKRGEGLEPAEETANPKGRKRKHEATAAELPEGPRITMFFGRAPARAHDEGEQLADDGAEVEEEELVVRPNIRPISSKARRIMDDDEGEEEEEEDDQSEAARLDTPIQNTTAPKDQTGVDVDDELERHGGGVSVPTHPPKEDDDGNQSKRQVEDSDEASDEDVLQGVLNEIAAADTGSDAE